jgi:hypothetical protein
MDVIFTHLGKTEAKYVEFFCKIDSDKRPDPIKATAIGGSSIPRILQAVGGQALRIEGSIGGREWQGKVFTSLVVTKVLYANASVSAAAPVQASASAILGDDEIPF